METEEKTIFIENPYDAKHWIDECFADDGGQIKTRMAKLMKAMNGIEGIWTMKRNHSQLKDHIDSTYGNFVEPLKGFTFGKLDDGLDFLIEYAAEEISEILSDDDFQKLNSKELNDVASRERLRRQSKEA